MLNKDSYKILRLPDLKLFCKGKIKLNQSKSALFECYNRYLAVKIIQRCYRRYFYRNAECSITLEKVNYPCFIYRSKFGKLFFYDLVSIVKYICKTGNTHDPMTREQYSDTILENLDLFVKKQNLVFLWLLLLILLVFVYNYLWFQKKMLFVFLICSKY
jgi:hypothetical protein